MSSGEPRPTQHESETDTHAHAPTNPQAIAVNIFCNAVNAASSTFGIKGRPDRPDEPGAQWPLDGPPGNSNDWQREFARLTQQLGDAVSAIARFLAKSDDDDQTSQS